MKTAEGRERVKKKKRTGEGTKNTYIYTVWHKAVTLKKKKTTEKKNNKKENKRKKKRIICVQS